MSRWILLMCIALIVVGAEPSLVPIAFASDCWVESFSVSPDSSPQPAGTVLSLYGRGNCSGGIRASRFNIDGGGFGEDAGAPEQSETWTLPEGTHTVCFEIAGGSNGDWSAGAAQCMTITGESSGGNNGGGACEIAVFDSNPPTPVGRGTSVQLYGRAYSGCGPVRIEIDSSVLSESGSDELSATWDTSNYNTGVYQLCFAILRGAGDWNGALRSCRAYSVTGDQPSGGGGGGQVCPITSFEASPASPVVVGTHVNLHGKGDCGTARFEINGQPRAEIGAPEQTETWKTEEFGVGTYQVCFALRGDGGWENAARSCKTYEVTSSVQPTSVPPVNYSCMIEFFNASHSSPVTLGEDVSLHGKGSCNNGGTSKFEINGQPRAEIGAPEQTEIWKTEEFGNGTYEVCFVLRGNGGWENAARSCKTFVVNNGTSPTTPPPTSTSPNATLVPPSITPVPPTPNDRLWHGSSSPPSGNWVRVNVWALRIRAQPNGTILGHVAYHDYYPLLEQRNGWGRVSTSSGEGWIFLDNGYATVHIEPQDTNTETPSQQRVTFDAVGAWFRRFAFQHIACAVFAVPNNIKIGDILFTWFQSPSDGTWISAGYYAQGTGLEAQFGVSTPEDTYLYGVCVTTAYFFAYPGARKYREEMNNSENWFLRAKLQ